MFECESCGCEMKRKHPNSVECNECRAGYRP